MKELPPATRLQPSASLSSPPSWTSSALACNKALLSPVLQLHGLEAPIIVMEVTTLHFNWTRSHTFSSNLWIKRTSACLAFNQTSNKASLQRKPAHPYLHSLTRRDRSFAKVLYCNCKILKHPLLWWRSLHWISVDLKPKTSRKANLNHPYLYSLTCRDMSFVTWMLPPCNIERILKILWFKLLPPCNIKRIYKNTWIQTFGLTFNIPAFLKTSSLSEPKQS